MAHHYRPLVLAYRYMKIIVIEHAKNIILQADRSRAINLILSLSDLERRRVIGLTMSSRDADNRLRRGHSILF